MIKLTNENYCATVVEIKTLIKLENCNNVQAALIMGNQVVVGNDVKVGDAGLFFPVETQLSKEYLSANNLYRNKELNSDKTKAGYFEENGRIRCVKFRGNKSEGLFMPLCSVGFVFSENEIDTWTLGDSFNEVKGIEICKKYIPKTEYKSDHVKHKNGKGFKKYETKLIDGQFRFHSDTLMLYKNLHRFTPEDLISITYKLHGTSGVSSKILCKKSLTWYEKILKKVGINIVEAEYGYVNSSRKVIKNAELNPNVKHYYGDDVWGLSDKVLRPYLCNGLTLYYEIVGYTPSGKYIQKDYDYGCIPPSNGEYIEGVNYSIYIYRITQTNNEGKVFEFSAKQVQDWCREKGLKAVPELYYGYAKDFIIHILEFNGRGLDTWQGHLLEEIKIKYNEKDCYLCKTKLPEEGCVIRIEGTELEAFKCKSTRFLEKETAQLDKGEVDIETEN